VLRFSIQIPGAPDAASWAEKMRRAEDDGFYSVSVPDHLGPSLPQLAPMVALAAAAPRTTTIRLAVTVLDNDFRHPVMVAKEAATLDLLSSGRLDLGLGAGWLEEDYTKTGLTDWDPPGVRVGRLIESIQLLRHLLTGDTVNFDGEHYHVHDFQSYPAAVQTPIPLIIGGRGRRVLSLAAREAQIVSILPAASPGGNSLAGFERQLEWIRQAGGLARPDLMVGLRIPQGEITGAGQSRRETAARFAESRGLSTDEVLGSPFCLVGDLSSVNDHLVELHERYGVAYVTLSEDLGWQVAPLVRELATTGPRGES
jgi:probable F420-dependent oxidoreductase